MGLWSLLAGNKAQNVARENPKSDGTLRFRSIKAMEAALDGGEAQFAEYYFALYHCSPDEPAGINERREQLRAQYPDKAIAVGRRFVLTGEAAYQAVAGYFRAMAECESFGGETRAYYQAQFDAVTDIHRKSQSLPVPIDLTEGQLASDRQLEILTCIALRNGQVALAQGD